MLLFINMLDYTLYRKFMGVFKVSQFFPGKRRRHPRTWAGAGGIIGPSSNNSCACLRGRPEAVPNYSSG
jgi:hypothetical protein